MTTFPLPQSAIIPLQEVDQNEQQKHQELVLVGFSVFLFL